MFIRIQKDLDENLATKWSTTLLRNEKKMNENLVATKWRTTFSRNEKEMNQNLSSPTTS
jgi:hypothetical protein